MKPVALLSASDEELADLAAKDQQAFQTLYDRYAKRVFGLLGTFSLSSHAVDDVAQAVWLKVWRSLSSRPNGAPFTAWLMQIARNTAIDELRKRKSIEVPEDVQIAASGHDDVAADVAETEEMTRLRGCIDKLQETERTIVVLGVFGVVFSTIAAVIGLTSDRVHRLFHDAKLKLQKCLGVSG